VRVRVPVSFQRLSSTSTHEPATGGKPETHHKQCPREVGTIRSACSPPQEGRELLSQVEESIEVDVPVRTAYDQWTQFEDFPQFMDGVERIEQRTDTLTHWVTKIGGVEREFDAEITEQIPDERVAWTTVHGEARQAGVVTFHRLDDTRTKVMLQLEYDPQGLTETVGDKLGFVKRQATGDLKRFKEFIESRGGVKTGAWRGTV
jgi:uncharacterized membrane protein